MVTMGYSLGWDKDLAHGGFWPSGEDKDLALRGLLAPWGGSDKDLAHGGFWPSGEVTVLAHGG